MTVENLLDQMSAAEFSEWLAFYRVEPFGEPWRQAGTICAVVGNAAGGKRAGGSFTFHDFLPIRPLLKHTAATFRQTGEQILAAFRMLAASSSADSSKGK